MMINSSWQFIFIRRHFRDLTHARIVDLEVSIKNGNQSLIGMSLND